MGMNRLTTSDRVRIVSALVEGNSIRATARMTGVSKDTVVKLLVDMGLACADAHDRLVRDLPCNRVQCDEVWSFCYAKDKNVPDALRGQPGIGSVWTWTALCSDTKMVVSYWIGDRDAECANRFMRDLAGRLSARCQLTTDGHRVYMAAVYNAFGTGIDYAMLVKLYGEPKGGVDSRYSPCDCYGAEKHAVIGDPKPAHVSTSHVERYNLTMRMGMRRFTRLTNAFSKKLFNLKCAVALHTMHYNFCRVHKSLRVTPAMEAGLADHVWTVEKLVGVLEADEQTAIANGALKRGRYAVKDSN